jgi:hypothetical protein
VLRVSWSFAKNITGLGNIGEPVFGFLYILGPEHLFQALLGIDAINNVRRFPFHDSRPKLITFPKGNIVLLSGEH